MTLIDKLAMVRNPQLTSKPFFARLIPFLRTLVTSIIGQNCILECQQVNPLFEREMLTMVQRIYDVIYVRVDFG